MKNEININSISNYYGCLVIKKEGRKYYWGITDWNDLIKWERIPKRLYDEIEYFHSHPNQKPK